MQNNSPVSQNRPTSPPLHKAGPLNGLAGVLRWLAQPHLFFFTLIWLMLLLIIGTVAQKYVGLYAAQHRYFSSFFIWFAGVPLPGGYLTISVIFVNLLCKLLLASEWSLKKSGIVITHLGALLLLLGGLFTALFSQEGFLMLEEGERSRAVTDYHHRELQLLPGEDESVPLRIEPASALKVGTVLHWSELPLTLEIKDYCLNCGMDASGKLVSLPAKPENEQNISGAEVVVKNPAGESMQTIIVYETQSILPVFTAGGREYRLALRKQKRILPFEVELVEFMKTVHPNTDIPASYASEVRIIDGTSEWRSAIRMNEPLRYKGYTLFQSSFVENDGKQASVLAVVENVGRLFPYIASIMMCVGLLLHLLLGLPRRIRKASP